MISNVREPNSKYQPLQSFTDPSNIPVKYTPMGFVTSILLAAIGFAVRQNSFPSYGYLKSEVTLAGPGFLDFLKKMADSEEVCLSDRGLGTPKKPRRRNSATEGSKMSRGSKLVQSKFLAQHNLINFAQK